MKHLQTIQQYNEASIARLISPTRRANDARAEEIFKDIKKDFEENNHDVRKIKIAHGDQEISFDKIEFGKNIKIWYLFGKYHRIKNAHGVMHDIETPFKKIELIDIPGEIILRKDALEKAFGVSPIALGKARLVVEETVDNPEYNPNYGENLKRFKQSPTREDWNKMRPFVIEKNEIKVSRDTIGKIVKYLVTAFDTKYPQLKSSKYKNTMAIDDLKDGHEIEIDNVWAKTKDNVESAWPVMRGETAKQIKNFVASKTRAELDYIWKQRQKKKYGKSNEEGARKYKELKNYFQPVYDWIKEQGEDFAGDAHLHWDNSTVSFLVKPKYEAEFFKFVQPYLDNFDLPGYAGKPVFSEERTHETYKKDGKFVMYEIQMPELD